MYAAPYVRAASLFVRAADSAAASKRSPTLGRARSRVEPPHMVPTRQGDVPAQFYGRRAASRRTVLLVPGIHSMGIDEPRLTRARPRPRRQRRHA